MSRFHDAIVSGIVFSFVVGLVCVAELTKDKTPQNETVLASVSDSKGGFSLTQVLVEQEMKTLANPKLKTKEHEEMVRGQAANLSKGDLKMLKAKARNSANSWEERYASAYLVKMAGENFELPPKPGTPARMIASVQKPTKGKVVTMKVVKAKAVAAKPAKATKKVVKHKAPQRRVASR